MALRRISVAAIFASLVLVLGWTVFKWTGAPAATEPGPDNDKEVLKRGKELFTREWTAGDRRSHSGDGLGPVYNAQSCAACHHLGGIGGAGNREMNVSLVTVFISNNTFSFFMGFNHGQELPSAAAPKKVVVGKLGSKVELEIPSQDELAKIHPALRTQNSFPLHRFGVGPEFALWKASIFPKDGTVSEGKQVLESASQPGQ